MITRGLNALGAMITRGLNAIGVVLPISVTPHPDRSLRVDARDDLLCVPEEVRSCEANPEARSIDAPTPAVPIGPVVYVGLDDRHLEVSARDETLGVPERLGSCSPQPEVRSCAVPNEDRSIAAPPAPKASLPPREPTETSA